MTNAIKVLYVFFIYLVTAYGLDDFNDILKEYKNIIEANGNPAYVPQRENFQNPHNVLQYDHQPYPFPYSRGDLEYDLRPQRDHVQHILRQVQELLNVITNLVMTRYQPSYFSAPVPFYPKTENHMYHGDSGGTTPVMNRFPEDDDDVNKVWGIVGENAANNETNSKCICKNADDITRSSHSASYMNAIDTPTRCKAATLSCCIRGYTEQQREDCFAAQRCQKIYKTGYACSPRIVRAVYSQLYGY